MADPVNLRQARKTAERKRAQTVAEQNRALHGVPAKQRRASQANRDLAERRHEAGRLEQPPPGKEAG